MSFKIDTFRERLEALRQRNAIERYYIVRQTLENLCTREIINDAVQCSFRSRDREVHDRRVQQIMDNGMLIFCILVCIREEQRMTTFLEHDTLDDKLPLNSMALGKLNLPPKVMNNFDEKQWEFKPVKFEKHQYKKVEDRKIFPYRHVQRRSDRDGGFGDMYEDSIDASMQDIIQPETDPKSGQKVNIADKHHSRI